MLVIVGAVILPVVTIVVPLLLKVPAFICDATVNEPLVTFTDFCVIFLSAVIVPERFNVPVAVVLSVINPKLFVPDTFKVPSF